MKLAIGNDHVAIEMKNEIKAHLESRGIEVINVGTDEPGSFDYAISGYKVAKMVAAGEVDGGVLICNPIPEEYSYDAAEINAVIDDAVKEAEEKGIKAQRDVIRGGGTDAGAIQQTRAGVFAGGISSPCRYVHTPAEMVDLNDVKACADLVVAFAEASLEKEC